jgi:Mg-chelatase subunit ChlD
MDQSGQHGLRIRIGDGEGARSIAAGTGTAVTVTAAGGHVFVVLDRSGSMEGRKLELAKEGVVRFATEAVGLGYAVGVVVFADTVQVACPPSGDPATVGRALRGLRADGTTDLARAIERTAGLLRGLPGSRALVLFTDGQPDDAAAALRAAQLAREAGIDILAVGTPDADADLLAAIATRASLAMTVPDGDIATGLARAAGLLSAGGGR